MTTEFPRRSEHPVEQLFLTRWSRRSFTGAAVPDADLHTIFEAARWAPSSTNSQPWRFLYAKTGTANFQTFLDVLMPMNQKWAHKASVLICAISYIKMDRFGEIVVSESHAFDTGAAWENLALQAHAMGYNTRSMGGFFRDKAMAALKVPEDYVIQAFIALGKPGRVEDLPQDYQAREVPTSRKKVEEFAFEGVFPGRK